MSIIKTLLLLLCISSLVYLLDPEKKSYSELRDSHFQPERLRNFYKKAVKMFSNDNLSAAISFFGIGTFCNKKFKPNDVVMEVAGNYTISSFDNIFPYFNVTEEILQSYLTANAITNEMYHEVRLLLNINWIRYVDNDNRFFRIFFQNMPRYRESLHMWDSQEKLLLQKLTNDHLIHGSLLFQNITARDFMLEDIRKKVRKIRPELPMAMLSEQKLQDGISIVYSRSLPMTLKGHKLIKNESDISENDFENKGLILIPGVDAINYERIKPEHPDTDVSQVKFTRGKVNIKAGKNFNVGDEFTINYDITASVEEIFRKYGFVPIEAIHESMIFSTKLYNVTNWSDPIKKICMSLGACMGTKISNFYSVPTFSNSYDLANLVLKRFSKWIGLPFTEEKMIEIYNQIRFEKHSNTTEGMALSSLADESYGNLLYTKNFRTDIKTILSMYEKNEENTPIFKNLMSHSFNKVMITKDSAEIRDRFREILKYCMVYLHILSINTKESIKRLNTTLDNLQAELKKDMLRNIE